MNAYFENTNTRYSSGKRNREMSAPRFGDGIITFICAVIGLISCPVAVALEKTALVFALFLSFTAVVGAIDTGMLSMFAGVLICGLISLCEYAVLKSLFKPLRRSAQKASEQNN